MGMKIKFATYVDYIKTGKNEGKVIYVGKGNAARIKHPWRNRKHKNIIRKYGFIRQVVLETFDEEFALEQEVKLIAELHTYVSDPLADKNIVCNFTLGGDGLRLPKEKHPFSGGSVQRKMWAQFTEEERSQILSDRNLKQWQNLTDEQYEERCKNAYRSTGYKHTEDAKLAISNGNKGKKKPGTSQALKGNNWCSGFKHKPKSCKNMSQGLKRRWAKHRLKHGYPRIDDEIILKGNI